jgi:hypothetical protein
LLRRTQLSTPLHVRQALQKSKAAHEGFSPAIAAPGFRCPLRRIQTGLCCRRVVTAASAASREVTCASEYYCSGVPGPLGCLIPPWRCRFRVAFAVFLPLPSPLSFVGGGSSRALRPSSEFSEISPPGASRRRAPSLGFAPHRDVSRRSPLPHGLPRAGHRRPTSAAFRPRRFARPRRLSPPSALRVYFAPLPRPGFALQGFCSANSRTDSSSAVALLAFEPVSCRQLPTGARDVPPSSGLCSVRGSVAARNCLGSAPPDPLLGFRLPPVLLCRRRDHP